MRGSPHSPRRQRKALYEADTFERRHRMTVALSRELRARFRRRSVPIRKGDTVRVLGGSFKGREERVARVSRRDYSVTLDNITLKTGEEKLKPLPMRPGHLVITRLNLADAWRRRALRVRDEDVTAEERGEAPSEEEAAAETAPEAPAKELTTEPIEVPEKEPTTEPTEAPEKEPITEPTEAPEKEPTTEAPAPAAPRPRRPKRAAPPEETE
jgi:large subunit ribosomal protein L24